MDKDDQTAGATPAPETGAKVPEGQNDDLKCPACGVDLRAEGVKAGYVEDQTVTISMVGGAIHYEAGDVHGGDLTGAASCATCGADLPHDSEYYGERFEGMPAAGPLGANEGGEEDDPDEEDEEPQDPEGDPAADALANHEAMEPPAPVVEDGTTPRPWAVAASLAHVLGPAGRVAEVYGLTPAETEANARLIIRAVNAHEDLLRTVEELSDWMRERTGPRDGTKDMLIRALEVIAKAKGVQ